MSACVGCPEERILEDGHAAERQRHLVRAPDPEAGADVGRVARDIPTVEPDQPRVRGEVAADEVEQACLAGPIRANDADRLACGYLERDRIRDDDSPERFRDGLKLEQDGHRGSRSTG